MSKILRRISIETPCSQSWDEMTGNEQVRFCSHCDLSVHDLSQMTRSKATRLVLKSKGRLCVRIHRDPIGEIITRPAVQKLHTISRRASRFAAGAFTAVISLSTAAYAQSTNNDPVNDRPPVAVTPVAGIPEPANIDGERHSEMGGSMVMVGYTQPLVKAAYENDLDAVNALLSNGENVNQAEEDGTTALELAVSHGNLDIVRRLLEAGADAGATGKNGSNILFSLDGGDNSVEMIDVLINAGAYINQSNEDGDTPLINAAESNDAALTRSLIDAGAYVDAQNKFGSSALMVAAEAGNIESVKALLAAGAIYSLRNQDNADALALARDTEHEDVCELLRAAGAVETPK